MAEEIKKPRGRPITEETAWELKVQSTLSRITNTYRDFELVFRRLKELHDQYTAIENRDIPTDESGKIALIAELMESFETIAKTASSIRNRWAEYLKHEDVLKAIQASMDKRDGKAPDIELERRIMEKSDEWRKSDTPNSGEINDHLDSPYGQRCPTCSGRGYLMNKGRNCPDKG